MNADSQNSYLPTAIRRFRYYKDLADKTFEQLSEQELHFSPAPDSNSIAVIIQHMAGNMLSRWTHFLTEDGEKEWRERDAEFEEKPLSKAGLLELWEKGWACLLESLESLTENDLSKTVHIRKEPLSVVDAINRQLAHYPYHVGQIAYIGKMIRGADWKSLSIPKGHSQQYNHSEGLKDPAKKY